MKNSKVCAVIMMLMLVVMLSGCGEAEETSADISEPASVMEEVVEPEISEEEDIITSETSEGTSVEEVIVSEESSVTEEESTEEVAEENTESEATTSTEGSDFATDTNLGGTEDEFMDYLEQNGFGGGQYYAPGESADDGEFQLGQSGVGGQNGIGVIQ